MWDIWTALVASNPSPGPTVYAKKTATIYSKMTAEAEKKFVTAGYGHCMLKKGEILADHHIARDHQLAALDYQIPQPANNMVHIHILLMLHGVLRHYLHQHL